MGRRGRRHFDDCYFVDLRGSKMGWTQGGTYFHGKNFMGAAACYDARGCFHLIGLSEDGHSIDHMIQGSRNPFPIQVYSISLPTKAVGTPTITFSAGTGYLRIFVPLENIGLREIPAKQEDFPDPSGDEPPPAKCPHPYPQGKLRVIVHTLLGGLAMKEIPEWPDAGLAKYYDALVADGVNAERYVSTCKPGDPYDPLEYWQLEDPEYLGVITKRLNLMRERDLTAIICLQPYRGTISDDRARWLIRALRGYPIIWECVNEPTSNDRQAQLVGILQSEGVENRFIQIQHVDAGAFYDLLHDTLNGEGLATYHWTGTMETVNAPWPKGWSTSSGTMEMMTLGLYGSNDGEDIMQAARGLNFWLHDHQDPPITKFRRPNEEQIGQVAAWMKTHGKGHVEHLSAAAYQRSARPNMDDAITIGHGERQAMAI